MWNNHCSITRQLDWVGTFLPLKPPESRQLQRYGTHTKFLTQLSPSFGKKSGNKNTRRELPHSIPVGAWQRGSLSSPNCVECPNAVESIRHALWDCPASHRIWRGVGRLLQLCQVQGSMKWGNICWLSWQTPVDRYEHQEEGMTLVIKAQEVFSPLSVMSTQLLLMTNLKLCWNWSAQ